MKRKIDSLQPFHVPLRKVYVGENNAEFFKESYGRRLNTLNPRYKLPVDSDEIKRFHLQHRMLQFVYDGSNYVGPVAKILSATYGERRPKVMDLGTGYGHWAFDIADAFPNADIVGVDLAPIQPKDVPPNCSFEVFDLEDARWPYPTRSVDVVHARFIYDYIRDYDKFLKEVLRILRPGGLIIVVEVDTEPIVDGTFSREIARFGRTNLAPGWCAFWNEYNRCLKMNGIKHKPNWLGKMIRETRLFHKIVRQHFDVPVGSWPKDDVEQTIGQFNFLSYDLMLPATEPFFRLLGTSEQDFKRLLSNAQADLYEYSVLIPRKLSNRLHVIHAIKKE